MGNSRPNSVLFCKLCIHFCLCKIDPNSCHSYAARFTCNAIPIDLTATQGRQCHPLIDQFKPLSCPLTHNNQRSITSTVWLMTSSTKIAIYGQNKTYNIPVHFMGRRIQKVNFAFPSFHNLPSLIYQMYYTQTAKCWGGNSELTVCLLLVKVNFHC